MDPVLFFFIKNDHIREDAQMGKKNWRKIPLAYGENRCQSPAFLIPTDDADPLAMHRYVVVSGEPSYISIADGDQIQEVLCLLATAFRAWKGNVPHIAVAGKHGNPCGLGVDWHDPQIATLKALRGDTIAVMGGEVITNFPITDDLAKTLHEANEELDGRRFWGLDIIFAPHFSEGAVELLGKKDKRRLMQNPALIQPNLPTNEIAERPVRGGKLTQNRSPFVLSANVSAEALSQIISDQKYTDILIAWAACWRASSNTVALAKDGMLIGLGCGQQDRIACVELCLRRAQRSGHDVKGSFFASDAFFPYATGTAAVKEGPELLVEAGCSGGVVPADGKKLDDVRNYFHTNDLFVIFVHKDNRGFSKH